MTDVGDVVTSEREIKSPAMIKARASVGGGDGRLLRRAGGGRRRRREGCPLQ